MTSSLLHAKAAEFVDNYLIDQNVGLAYLRTGGLARPETWEEAQELGAQVLAHPDVQAALIPRLRDDVIVADQITKERVTLHLASIAFCDPKDSVERHQIKNVHDEFVEVEIIKDIQAMPTRARLAIKEFDFSGVKRTFKTHDKLKSIELLMKLNGWTTEDVANKKRLSDIYTDEELKILEQDAKAVRK